MRYVLAGLMLAAVAGVVVAGVVLTSAKASLSADPVAMAKIGMPLGGGSIESVSVVTGPHSQPVPVKVTGGKLYPDQLIPANAPLQIQVTVKRPGWISWLAGSTQKLQLNLTTPVASLRSHYITVRKGDQLRAHFKAPISAYTFGTSPGHMSRTVLPRPSDVITLPHSGRPGRCTCRPRPASGRRPRPPRSAGSRRADRPPRWPTRRPARTIKPATPITLTFSKPVGKALGSHMPPVSPGTPGTWHRLNSHTIQFEPRATATGLAPRSSSRCPSGVRLVGGQSSSAPTPARGRCPAGRPCACSSCWRSLGYLPLNFHYASGQGPGLTPGRPGERGRRPAGGHVLLAVPEHAVAAEGHVAGRSRRGR